MSIPSVRGRRAIRCAAELTGANSAAPDQIVAAVPCFADLILHVVLCHGRRIGMALIEPIENCPAN
jgi:hypothetical protein